MASTGCGFPRPSAPARGFARASRRPPCARSGAEPRSPGASWWKWRTSRNRRWQRSGWFAATVEERMTTTSETIAMRDGERIAAGALRDYLRDRIEGAESGVELEQFPNGHSNLTYLLRAGGREYVLRRPPLGPVAPKAHDMVREYHVLRAVHPHFPEAPEAFLVCEDPAVLGAPFFIMERRHGAVLREEIPPAIASVPSHPTMIGEAFLDALVRLHAIDIAAAGVSALGKPEGYVERQGGGWAARWERAQTEAVPELDQVVRWLGARMPAPVAPSLIHNDYKLDNIMLAAA